jgi:hypothetical protein
MHGNSPPPPCLLPGFTPAYRRAAAAMLDSLGFSTEGMWFPCVVAVLLIGLALRAAALGVLVGSHRHSQGRRPLCGGWRWCGASHQTDRTKSASGWKVT